MATLTIAVDFRDISSHRDLVKSFESAHDLGEEDVIELTINFSSANLFIHSDHLLVIVAMVDYFRSSGVTVEIDIVGRNDYASRVNFFKLLGVHYVEDFVRHQKAGKFIELYRFDNDSIYRLQDDLTMIIHQMGNVAIEVKQLIFYCLSEIMDNVLIHSGKVFGWVAAQVFPKRREIRLVICDNGVGVLESLRSSGREAFFAISEPEALEMSLQRGITNGKGLGFGLYATS